MTPVANDHVTHVSDAFAVDENAANLDGLDLLSAAGCQFENVAIVEQKTVFLRDADLLGQPTVTHQMTVFAVDRHKVARSSELQHNFQLFLTGVAGNVDFRNLFVMDFGAAAIEMIDQVRDYLLVAGNKLRRENHGVA